jgi:hypothetical protein
MSTASPSRGRLLRVAGVQVESRNGEVEANLARAAAWVAQAAERGAQRVLCPISAEGPCERLGASSTGPCACPAPS